MKMFDPWAVHMLQVFLVGIGLFIFYLATKSDDEKN